LPDLREELVAHFSQTAAAPFLFVGAGFSRRYLQLDRWEALLRRMADLTSKDYDYFRASAGGDLPTIASEIAKELHEPWWTESRFAANREAYGESLRGRESALKAETCAYLSDATNQLPGGGLGKELDLLGAAVVDGVITTNFDSLLERIFPTYKVFVGQEQLLFGDALSVGEIYKIHGSLETPDSLVLTADDYALFDKRNVYLAAKLMTIFVEHPVVFLGYSLGDRNVASILESIVGCLETKESVNKLADRLVFVQWDSTVSEPHLSSGAMKVGDMTIPMKVASVPDFESVFHALGDLQRGFPAKLLRQLKEQVYELVLEDNPKGRLHVVELTKEDDIPNVDVVFGVGAIEALRAYVGFDRHALVEDTLNAGDLMASRVVTETLPQVLISKGNVPIYKYLRGAGMLDSNGELLETAEVPTKVANRHKIRSAKLAVLPQYKAQAEKVVADGGGLDAMIKEFEPHVAVHCIPAIPSDEIDPETLRRFLIRNQSMYLGTAQHSQWMKVACIYDWVEYGLQKKSKPRKGKRPKLKGRPRSA
jgi:SIR2-like domain